MARLHSIRRFVPNAAPAVYSQQMHCWPPSLPANAGNFTANTGVFPASTGAAMPMPVASQAVSQPSTAAAGDQFSWPETIAAAVRSARLECEQKQRQVENRGSTEGSSRGESTPFARDAIAAATSQTIPVKVTQIKRKSHPTKSGLKGVDHSAWKAKDVQSQKHASTGTASSTALPGNAQRVKMVFGKISDVTQTAAATAVGSNGSSSPHLASDVHSHVSSTDQHGPFQEGDHAAVGAGSRSHGVLPQLHGSSGAVAAPETHSTIVSAMSEPRAECAGEGLTSKADSQSMKDTPPPSGSDSQSMKDAPPPSGSGAKKPRRRFEPIAEAGWVEEATDTATRRPSRASSRRQDRESPSRASASWQDQESPTRRDKEQSSQADKERLTPQEKPTDVSPAVWRFYQQTVLKGKPPKRRSQKKQDPSVGRSPLPPNAEEHSPNPSTGDQALGDDRVAAEETSAADPNMDWCNVNVQQFLQSEDDKFAQQFNEREVAERVARVKRRAAAAEEEREVHAVSVNDGEPNLSLDRSTCVAEADNLACVEEAGQPCVQESNGRICAEESHQSTPAKEDHTSLSGVVDGCHGDMYQPSIVSVESIASVERSHGQADLSVSASHAGVVQSTAESYAEAVDGQSSVDATPTNTADYLNVVDTVDHPDVSTTTHPNIVDMAAPSDAVDTIAHSDTVDMAAHSVVDTTAHPDVVDTTAHLGVVNTTAHSATVDTAAHPDVDTIAHPVAVAAADHSFVAGFTGHDVSAGFSNFGTADPHPDSKPAPSHSAISIKASGLQSLFQYNSDSDSGDEEEERGSDDFSTGPRQSPPSIQVSLDSTQPDQPEISQDDVERGEWEVVDQTDDSSPASTSVPPSPSCDDTDGWQVVDQAEDEEAEDETAMGPYSKYLTAPSSTSAKRAKRPAPEKGNAAEATPSQTQYPVSMTGACPFCYSSDVIYLIVAPESKPDSELPALLRNLLLCHCAIRFPPPKGMFCGLCMIGV